VLCLEGWAGRGEIPCEILRRNTAAPVHQTSADCLLPGGRRGREGEEVEVPKYAIRREREGFTR
jgi:hypothetical protein